MTPKIELTMNGLISRREFPFGRFSTIRKLVDKKKILNVFAGVRLFPPLFLFFFIPSQIVALTVQT